MRLEKFHMERDVLNVGDEVAITEGTLPLMYYYTAEPAAAMSGNYRSDERIQARSGIVREKIKEGSSFILTIEFEN